MHKLIDKLALLLLCLIGMTPVQPQWKAVVVLLAAVAVSSLNSYLEGKTPVFLCYSYAAVCLLIPECFMFLPLIVYDFAGLGKWPLRLSWVAALPMCLVLRGPQALAVTALLSGLAFLLQYRSASQVKAREAFFMLTDDTKERSMHLERKNRELMEKQDYEVRLAKLSERNRIAREIHDNVGHLLTRSILQIGALRVTHNSDPAMTDALTAVNDTLSDAMDSIRSSVHELHDESTDLEAQLRAMTDGFQFCAVKLHYDAGDLPGDVKYCFIAIVREALSNIARHSNATEVSVTVREHPAFCRLTVEDNGTARPAVGSNGIGLQNMRDRVDALGGVFRLEQAKGFTIFVTVPKESQP